MEAAYDDPGIQQPLGATASHYLIPDMDTMIHPPGGHGDDMCTNVLEKLAFDVLGETAELRSQRLVELKEALRVCETIPDDLYESYSESQLIAFLRGKKFVVADTLKCLVRRYSFEKDHPEWMEPLDNSEIALFNNYYCVLEGVHCQNYILCCLKAIDGVKPFQRPSVELPHDLLIRNVIWFFNRFIYIYIWSLYI